MFRHCAAYSRGYESSILMAEMRWYHALAYFVGGLFLVNAVPHFVAGICGSPFQSPFASPPGEGLSSSTVNVLWGAFNFAVAYVLLLRVGKLDIRQTKHLLPFVVGALLASVILARAFGRFHGGLL